MQNIKVELKSLKNTISITKWIAFSLVLLVPLAYFIWFWVFNKIPLSIDSGKWGTFGDFVGGILNPIIALLAFYWLTQSVVIQKTELSETQATLAETEKTQKEQAKTQELKRFDDAFYSMLNQFTKIMDSLDHQEYTKIGIPRETKIDSLRKSVFDYEELNTLSGLRDRLRDHDFECKSLFIVLYLLLKYIYANNRLFGSDDKKVSELEKMYSNMIRAIIDNKIMQLIALNCVIGNGDDDYHKYKFLLERYEFFEHLVFNEFHSEELYASYEKSAFGNNKNFMF